jgi:hypothetical protein
MCSCFTPEYSTEKIIGGSDTSNNPLAKQFIFAETAFCSGREWPNPERRAFFLSDGIIGTLKALARPHLSQPIPPRKA